MIKYQNKYITILIISLCTLLSGCLDGYILDTKVIEKSGVVYDKLSMIPITGIVVSKSKFGTLKSRIHYKNGIMHGYYTQYYPNGALKSHLNYQNGIPTGIDRLYSATGQLILQYRYEKKRLTIESYYQNGKRDTVEIYVNGLLDGKYIRYFDNGQIEVLASYKEGKLNGLIKSYNKNGKILSENNYLNGKIVHYTFWESQV
jgi:antitoxin component YwqK of YwqJK toxin-antitoxin module